MADFDSQNFRGTEYLMKCARMSGVTGTVEQLVDFADLVRLQDRAQHHELNLKRINNQLKEITDRVGKQQIALTGSLGRLKRLERMYYDVLTEADDDLESSAQNPSQNPKRD